MEGKSNSLVNAKYSVRKQEIPTPKILIAQTTLQV